MNRKDRLLMLLENKNDWINGEELACLLQCSDRTIRSDVKTINDTCQTKLIISDTKKGYRLNKENTITYHKKNDTIPETPEERCSYILQKLLLKNKKININQLIKNIYISEYSLDNDLKKIKEIIKDYPNLSIIKKDNYIFLNGEETAKRALYKNMLLKETQKNFLNMDEIADLYKKFDLIKAKQILESLLHSYNYDINEINFPILMIHIGISIERILEQNYVKSVPSSDIEETIEYKIATDFYKSIAAKFQLLVVEAEIVLLSKLLISKKNYVAKNLLFNNELQLEKIVAEMLNYIYSQYGINLTSNKDLLFGLTLHISNLLQRISNKVNSTNFYLNEIKKRFPLVFELSISASDFLSKMLNIEISEDEIGYIALHIGMAYSQLNTKKYKTVLIFPKTQAISKIPIQKIENTFLDTLEIIDHLTYFEENIIKKLNPDLIICNAPLKHQLNIETVQISFFINYEDESKIRNAIFNLNQKRLKEEYNMFLDNVISPKHFYTNMSFDSYTDALKFMCDNLYQNKIVEKSFYSSVIKREKMSYTSFAYSFAIPHALDSSLVYKPSISIMILEKPLIWGEYEVKIIFLLALDRFNNHLLTLFFEWITNLYNDISSLNLLLSSNNYEEFVSILK